MPPTSPVGGLIGLVSTTKNGLMTKEGFISRGDVSSIDANTLGSGYGYFLCGDKGIDYGSLNYPFANGSIFCINNSSRGVQFAFLPGSTDLYERTKWAGSWSKWVNLQK